MTAQQKTLWPNKPAEYAVMAKLTNQINKRPIRKVHRYGKHTIYITGKG